MSGICAKIYRISKLKWIKISLLFLNFFFWVAGLTLICAGASVELNLYDVSVVVSEVTSSVAVVLIIVGIIIFVLSFIGCVSVIRENTKLITVFSIVLFIMFIVEIGAGVSAYLYRKGIHKSILDLYLKTLHSYPTEPNLKVPVDRLQKQFHCCGAVIYSDWFNTTLRNAVPDSCCMKETPHCGTSINETTNIYTQGCIDKIGSWIHEHSILIGGIGVGFGVAQVAGVVFCFLLVKHLEAEYEVM